MNILSIAEKLVWMYLLKRLLFVWSWKLKKIYLFFYLYFGKIYNKGQTYNKAYLERFNVGMRLMNTSLDIHVNSLSNKIIIKSVNIAWNLRIAKDAKNGKNDALEWCKKWKKCKQSLRL